MTESPRSPPVVSIVTICRNAVDIIEATLDSVLAQDYPTIEYIVIDGASDDGTTALLRQRQQRDGFLLVSEPDNGIADAMNKGVTASSGTLILHLHAGDTLHDPSVVERAVASYLHHRWRWACGAIDLVDAHGTSQIRGYHLLVDGANLNAFLMRNPVNHQATFLERRVFSQFGGFDPGFRICMDYEYWLRLLPHTPPFVLPFTVTKMLLGGLSGRARVDAARESIRARRRHLAPYPLHIQLWDRYLLIQRATIQFIESRAPLPVVRRIKQGWRALKATLSATRNSST